MEEVDPIVDRRAHITKEELHEIRELIRERLGEDEYWIPTYETIVSRTSGDGLIAQTLTTLKSRRSKYQKILYILDLVEVAE